jgi:hypothetical protein
MGMIIISENPDVIWSASNHIFRNILEYVMDNVSPDLVMALELDRWLTFDYLELANFPQQEKDLLIKLVLDYYNTIIAEDNESGNSRTYFVSKIHELHLLLQAILP